MAKLASPLPTLMGRKAITSVSPLTGKANGDIKQVEKRPKPFSPYTTSVFNKLSPVCQAVIVTESPMDAAVLFAASKWTNLPAISVLGKGNTKALSADLHRQVLSDAIGDDGTIFVWVEPDADGFAQKVADALQRPVKVISAPDANARMPIDFGWR